MKALACALLLVGCSAASKLPQVSSQQVQDAQVAARAGACVLHAVQFFGDPRKLSLEQSAQLAADLLECVPVSAPVQDGGA